MYDDLKALAIGLGNSIHAARRDLVREGADNGRWKEALKERSELGMRGGLEAHLPADVAIRVIETPYSLDRVGRGAGKNELSCRVWERGPATRTITVLADVVDGSWNAACGLPWSASTMLAFTEIGDHHAPADALALRDFKCGLIVPLVGSVSSPNAPAGFYYGVAGEPPRYRVAGSPTEYPLHPTDMDDVRQSRFFLDLFTAQTYESLAISIEAVKPLIYDWGDIGRFYGAGIELMSLLGTPGTTPGFGGYVAANQKADNLIPTTMLLQGAGVTVTSWWGEPIDRMKIMERMYVAIAATRPLHEHMIGHLSKTVRLP